jgi:hypothetical protein
MIPIIFLLAFIGSTNANFNETDNSSDYNVLVVNVPRWRLPCTAEQHKSYKCRLFQRRMICDNDVATDMATATMGMRMFDAEFTSINRNSTARCLRLIHSKTIQLKAMVLALKSRYATDIFRDDMITLDLDALDSNFMGLIRWERVANVSEDGQITDVRLIRLATNAWEDLAKLSVHLTNSKIQEAQSQTSRISLASFYDNILTHHAHGMYYIMCLLAQILDGHLSVNSTARVIQSIPIVATTDTVRYTRDYLILRDTERKLASLMRSVTVMARHVRV